MGSQAAFQCISEHPGGIPGCISVHPVFDGPASLPSSGQCWCIGERGYGNCSTPTHDSAELPFFHGSPPFLHRHVPPQSPHSHPLHPPLHREQQPLPWDCSTLPKVQLPATAPSREPASLSRGYMAPRRTD